MQTVLDYWWVYPLSSVALGIAWAVLRRTCWRGVH